MAPLITLTTDFGLSDGDVSVTKGVIKGIAPEAELIDVTHLIPPQNIAYAAVVLERTVPYFPPGTIHMCVVDPGVGTARRGMAAQIGAQFYVGPDNGTLTRVLAYAEAHGWPVAGVQLDQPAYWRAEVSSIFHGRDIFAPVCAHLAKGVPLAALGAPLADPVRLPLRAPQRTATGWRGEIIFTDHFGNLTTNLRAAHLADLGPVGVRLAGAEIRGLARTFGDRAPGELTALINHVGELEVSEINGHAQKRLGARIGDPIDVFQLG